MYATDYDPDFGQRAHSASVSLRLLVGDRRITLAQAAPDHVILRDVCEVAAGADVISEALIDGRCHHWAITLPDGISADAAPGDIVRVANRRYLGRLRNAATGPDARRVQ